ncbi:MAG: glycerol-3-phosphate 1-O-acyltransferase [Planctomycetota bacterium]|nr:MAG: glycerol-3-phosphate 1-O-acyltransferase [Planctomycetota bacterium]
MDPTWIPGAAAVGLAYLIGSIPFGWLIARAVAGVDVRRAGSGNIGATNVARVLGKTWGAVVLLLDAAKGALPVALLPRVFDPACPHLPVLCGTAAIVGHMFPIWLCFRGGKGVATALGVVAVLAPLACALAAVAFAVTFGLTRIVSLSSLVAAGAFCAVQLALLAPNWLSTERMAETLFSVGVPLLIAFRHRSNIVRLLQGTEPRFGRAAQAQSGDADAVEQVSVSRDTDDGASGASAGNG